MNSTFPTGSGSGETLTPSGDFLVTATDLMYFRAIVQYGIQITVQILGIASNIVNILVFTKMGLNESMTITFLGLAVSDMLHLVTYLVYRVIPMVDFYIGITSGICARCFAYPFSLYAIYFYDVSMYITVFAAVQKCCCVTFPLRFKNTFTRRRTCLIIATEYVVTLAIFMPVLTGLPFTIAFNPATNKSLISVKKLSHYAQSEFYWQSVVKVVLTPLAELTVIVCLIVMTKKLRASAGFRSSSKAGKDDAAVGETVTVKLGKNEIRALRAVQFVCFTFIIASLPPNVAYLVQSVYPPLSSPYMLKLKHVLYNSMYFLGSINASVNLFFYLKFNTNFKNVFWDTFGCFRCVGNIKSKSEEVKQ